MTVLAVPSVLPRSRQTGLWLALAIAAFGMLALGFATGAAGGWSSAERWLAFGTGAAVTTWLFTAAARRPELNPRLRQALGINAAAFGLTAVSYLYAVLTEVTPLPAVSDSVDALVTLLTYAVALVGLLRWPMTPLRGTRWWHFGLDAAIGAGGMVLFFVVLITLPGTAGTVPADYRRWVMTYGAALLIDLVAINILVVRGIALPSRRAFWTFMSALLLEIVSLVVTQYLAISTPPGAANVGADAIYVLLQLLYVLSGVLFLHDVVREPSPTPAPSWMLTFNPLPLLSIIGVAVLVSVEGRHGNGKLAALVAEWLVVLVLLLVVRYMATARENQQLVRQEAAAEREKLEALRRIAGGISHEFNNMLTAVIGHAELGLSEVGPASRVSGDLEGIRAAASRAAGLTQELLAFSGGQPRGDRPVDLAALVQSLEADVREAVGERVTVVPAVPTRPAMVRGDAAQLRELLVMLARCAGRRMPEGGRLELAVRPVVLETPLVAAALAAPPGRYIGLFASDGGQRLSEAELAHIFEPFFPFEGNAGVPMIGLAGVYGVVAAHRGGLAVGNRVEGGIRIGIYLPAGE